MGNRNAPSSVPVLLPRPRVVRRTEGACALGRDGKPASSAGPDVRVGDAAPPHPEGYRLSVEPRVIRIEARDAAAAFRAHQTFRQLCRWAAPRGEIPGLVIEDWPDFPVRGVTLDISRDKVPTMATLYELVDLLAELKYNQIQLYMEHTFAYRRHPSVWANASPLTGEEIESLDVFCRERFMELVPNQNSFGHMERWLIHPEYADLAETPLSEGERGRGLPGYMSLCAVDPRSIDLIAGLYDELLPHFTSRQLNVGLDETIDLGKGRSRDACEARGAGRVYLDYLLGVHREVTARGRTMQFWGDIILHHPELIPELPKDLIALDWGYEADHPFDDEGAKFASAGLRHVVCPGTSSWLSIAGRTDNAIANIRAAAKSARKHGALGLLLTDWGDLGHWQPLPVSFLGWAYGASQAWSGSLRGKHDPTEALGLHVFRDRAGVAASVARDLGNAYLETGVAAKNSTVLALLLLFPDRSLTEGRLAGITADGLDRAERFVAATARRLDGANLLRPDGRLLLDELRLAADLLVHACRFGRARLAAPGHAVSAIPQEVRRELAADLDRILPEYRRIWLLRNRPGGLDDSAGRLEALRRRYD